MGADKANLKVDGRPLGRRALDALKQAGVARRYASIRQGQPIGWLDDREVAVVDKAQDQGPMGGLVSTWEVLEFHRRPPALVIVLSADLLEVHSCVIQALIAASGGHVHGSISSDGTLQPLVAAYTPVAMLEIASAYYRGVRSLRTLLPAWDLAEVRFQDDQLKDADFRADLDGRAVDWH